MGPQLFSYGNSVIQRMVDEYLNVLQWGHNFSVMEIKYIEVQYFNDIEASMGPQLFSYGNHLTIVMNG